MLAKLFDSKGSRRILSLLTLLALLLCGASLAIPLLRQNSAMEQTGGQGVSRFQSMALAVSYLEGDELAYGTANPQGDSFYNDLNGLLSKAAGDFALHRCYILAPSVGGGLYYLADSGLPGQGSRPASTGESYPAALYPKKCLSLAESLLENGGGGAYYSQPIGEGLVVCYFPLTDGKNIPTALLGIEVSLENPNFTQYSFVNFRQVSLWSGIVFVVLLLLWMLVRSSRKTAALKEKLAQREKEAMPEIPPADESISSDEEKETP